ncbi:MAG: HGxxPAAW family protein [Propionicimonas sp.]
MIESAERATGTVAKEYHHGRTPAAWAGSIIAAVAFVLGAIAFITGPNWTLLWVSAVLLLIALVTGSVLRRMGFGQA